jgi:hypothetical protein
MPSETGDLAMEQDNTSSVRAAIQPAALKAAMVPHRPVFRNPWDSEEDMFATYAAISIADPLLLWAGGELTGWIFGFDSHWSLGVFMAAALVGAAGFITITGRERTSLSVDALAITAWVLLGLIVAPVIGLALPGGVAIACYAVLLLAILVYVLRFGHWETAFLSTVSWPITWSLLALLFALSAHQFVFYP